MKRATKKTRDKKERRKERYKRIYDQFIADRQLKVKALLESGAFVHKHHIVPSCMGGGDEKENMIPLTTKDHNWAHIFLARAYDGGLYSRDLWFSVIATFGSLSAQEGYTFTKREIEYHAIAKEEAGKSMRGAGNPNWGKSEGMSIKTLSRAHDGPFDNQKVAASFLRDNYPEVWEFFISLPDVNHRQAYAKAYFDPDSREFKRKLSRLRDQTLCDLAKSRDCQTLGSKGAGKAARAFLKDKAPEALAEAEAQFALEDELTDYYRKLLGITHNRTKSKYGYTLTPERTKEVIAAAKAKGYKHPSREQSETFLNKNHKEFFNTLVARYLEEDEENAAILS